MRPNEIDLALHLLDDQVVDSEGERCGRVDDVELSGGAGQATRVAGLLLGTAAWPSRLPAPFDSVLRLFTPDSMVLVPWEAVEDVTTTVKLAATDDQLGIGTGDGRSVRFVNERPEGRLRLSSLLGAPAVSREGGKLGRVLEVRGERMRPDPDAQVKEAWVVTGLLVGKRGLVQRLGASREQRGERRSDAPPPPNFIGWNRVAEIGPAGVTVAADAPG